MGTDSFPAKGRFVATFRGHLIPAHGPGKVWRHRAEAGDSGGGASQVCGRKGWKARWRVPSAISACPPIWMCLLFWRVVPPGRRLFVRLFILFLFSNAVISQDTVPCTCSAFSYLGSLALNQHRVSTIPRFGKIDSWFPPAIVAVQAPYSFSDLQPCHCSFFFKERLPVNIGYRRKECRFFLPTNIYDHGHSGLGWLQCRTQIEPFVVAWD